ncbi:hypothetical protein HBI07_172370 [Parastagonospora nodorum]|nr:hypothetical protein HBI07_172370 [Parastagonospora nodorum]
MEHLKDDGQRPEDIVPNERPSKRRRISVQPHREVGLMRSVRGDKFSGFVGSASGIYFIRSVYGALRDPGVNLSVTGSTPVSDVVPGEDDQLPTVLPYTSGRLWRDDEISSKALTSVSYEEFVELSGSYFANWHMLYPFLHAPSVLGYFQELSFSSESSTSQELKIVIVRSVLSISLADQRQAGHASNSKYPSEVVFSSHDAAVDSLQHVLTKPTSILGLQATISVQLFLVSMLRLNAASRLGGLVNRMAVQLGLHRCPARYASFSVTEKELRQRIFWSLYTIDRFICQSMGLPLGINDDDVDVCFPNAEAHTDAQRAPHLDNRLRLQSFIARESRLRGEIIELRNKSLHYVHRDGDQATAITSKLAQWWKDIEDTRDTDSSSVTSPYYSTILALLKHESIISLHRPVLAASRQGAEYDTALQLCIGSAQSIILELYGAVNTDVNSRERLTLLWPSCTWAVWISTFILFYAVNNGHMTEEFVIRLAEQSIAVLQHLARRGSAWPEASAAAIRDLRSRMMRHPIDNAKEDQNGIVDKVVRRPQRMSLDSVSAAPHRTAPTAEASVVTPGDPGYGLAGIDQADQGYPFGALRTAGDMQLHDSLLHDWGQQDSPYDPEVATFSTFLNSHLESQGDGPGYLDALDPFSGFDIPFWFEQDQHWDVFQDYNPGN